MARQCCPAAYTSHADHERPRRAPRPTAPVLQVPPRALLLLLERTYAQALHPKRWGESGPVVVSLGRVVGM
jgi:hypothetical protein